MGLKIMQVCRVHKDDLRRAAECYSYLLKVDGDWFYVSDTLSQSLIDEIDGISHCFTEIGDGDETEYELENGDLAYLSNWAS